MVLPKDKNAQEVYKMAAILFLQVWYPQFFFTWLSQLFRNMPPAATSEIRVVEQGLKVSSLRLCYPFYKCIDFGTETYAGTISCVSNCRYIPKRSCRSWLSDTSPCWGVWAAPQTNTLLFFPDLSSFQLAAVSHSVVDVPHISRIWGVCEICSVPSMACRVMNSQEALTGFTCSFQAAEEPSSRVRNEAHSSAEFLKN